MDFFDNEKKDRPKISKNKSISAMNKVSAKLKRESESLDRKIEERPQGTYETAQLKSEPLHKMSITVNKDDYLDLKEFVDQIKQYRKDQGIRLPFDGSKVSMNPIMKALLNNLVMRMDQLDVSNLIFEEDVYQEVSKLFKDVTVN